MSLDDRLLQAVRPLEAVRPMVVFGSAARASLAPHSDVDIGLLLEGEGTLRLQDLEVALGRAAGRRVDVIDLAAAPPQLRFEIARGGRPLLERRPHLWADFRARAMIDWWDWAPTARRLHAAAVARVRKEIDRGAP